MESSYKIDEGYSEEPMRMESGIDDDDDGIGPNDLLDRVMNISEMEQSGVLLCFCSVVRTMNVDQYRTRISSTFKAQSFVNSRSLGPLMACIS